MIYQKLLAGTDPYFADLSPGGFFELHCHPEIELSYCVQGSYTIEIGEREYALQAGDLVIVNPMAAHELKPHVSPDSLRLTIEIGAAFLGEQFAPFVSMNRDHSIWRAPFHEELSDLLDETAALLQEKTPFFNLLLKGNLYKISAVLLKLFAESKPTEPAVKNLEDVERIGLAVNMIYNHYSKPITLDEVSDLCGYSKSNFCKLIKAITGESFHALLNRHRVDVACLRLAEPETSIEEIALSVGFADSKSFCRVFKKITGQSAGAYRKGIQR